MGAINIKKKTKLIVTALSCSLLIFLLLAYFGDLNRLGRIRDNFNPCISISLTEIQEVGEAQLPLNNCKEVLYYVHNNKNITDGISSFENKWGNKLNYVSIYKVESTNNYAVLFHHANRYIYGKSHCLIIVNLNGSFRDDSFLCSSDQGENLFRMKLEVSR